ncbi:MAG: hypothetical protein HW400_52 [Candidatus Levybacteria bacterium]|nr:hypothetical protein [Candidatus Levybacteria bacterium]
MAKNKIYFYIKVLSVIGILLATYLLYEQSFRPAFNPCNISATVNCDAIISGSVSKTLGIPTPLYGLIGYIVILFAAILQRKKLVLGMATFGLAFCLWIAYQEFLLRVICPLCIACQLIMISVFVLALILIKNKDKENIPQASS